MTDPQPVQITAPALTDRPRVRHAFFTRQGGVSEGVYDSLNVGYGSDDSRDAVAENRRRAMAALGQPVTALNTVYQIHSADAVVAAKNWDYAQAPRADAMATDRPGIVLGILTADCVPVLFAGETGDGRPVIGAAHAGWRGALAGVIEQTVAAMVVLGATRAGIAAAIGPCIVQASYEVGPEFPAPFLAQDAANEAFFAPADGTGRWLFDLAGYVGARLDEAGIGRWTALGKDTYAGEYFSYRRATHRGEDDYGRNLSAIRLAR